MRTIKKEKESQAGRTRSASATRKSRVESEIALVQAAVHATGLLADESAPTPEAEVLSEGTTARPTPEFEIEGPMEADPLADNPPIESTIEPATEPNSGDPMPSPSARFGVIQSPLALRMLAEAKDPPESERRERNRERESEPATGTSARPLTWRMRGSSC